MAFLLRHPFVFLAGLIAAVLLLRGCGADDAHTRLPEGPQTLSGTLVDAGVSMVRNGTHILVQEGEERYYVESSSVNLGRYENMEVAVTGTLHLNTDPRASPVLIASDVRPIHAAFSEIAVPQLSLSLAVPAEWTAQHLSDGVRFSLSDASETIFKAYVSALAALPDDGDALFVDGQPAVRIATASGTTVYVERGRNILAFSVTDDALPLPDILLTVRFSSGATPSVPASAEDATDTPGDPCGGAAGILCPSGSYCEVTDPALGIGRCRRLQ